VWQGFMGFTLCANPNEEIRARGGRAELLKE
jgi:hypothetical protein